MLTKIDAGIHSGNFWDLTEEQREIANAWLTAQGVDPNWTAVVEIIQEGMIEVTAFCLNEEGKLYADETGQRAAIHSFHVEVSTPPPWLLWQ